MYKIYSREIEQNLNFRNLMEVERFFINEYKNNKIKLIEGNYPDVKYHVYEEKVDGITYVVGGLYAVSIKTGHDSYGNPLYMILVFAGDKLEKTIKSKQSYNIDSTVHKIFNNI